MKQCAAVLPLAQCFPRLNPGKLAVLARPVFRLSVLGHFGKEESRVEAAREELRSNPAAREASPDAPSANRMPVSSKSSRTAVTRWLDSTPLAPCTGTCWSELSHPPPGKA